MDSKRNETCVFCELVNHNEECLKIYESDKIFAFLDSDPINEGHVLIITKKHFLDVDEIDIAILNEINVLTKKIVKTLKNIYKLDGYSIMQNGGKFNDIGHYHLHIFPRYVNDGFSWIFDETDKEFNKEVQNKILIELNKNI